MDDLNRKGLLLAIHEHELRLFLEGSGIYKIGYNPFLPGESIIDFESAIGEFYQYFKEKRDPSLVKLFEDTLCEMIKYKSGEGVFEVFLILTFQFKMEKSNEAPFKVNRNLLMKEFNMKAELYKEKLKKFINTKERI